MVTAPDHCSLILGVYMLRYETEHGNGARESMYIITACFIILPLEHL